MHRQDGYSVETQLERTILSWNRSALAAGANGGLLVREGFERGLPAVVGIGFAIIAAAAAVWATSMSFYGRTDGRRLAQRIVHRERSMLMLTVFVLGLSVGDLALVSTA